ncbi:lipid IV(A) 3-deoxy-D-manno-octulosonic acid transferase [Herminiimonas sp. CN]|uniref:lipid IV(A) 3-deoxy-D-manno-octulosonic acid transferase n=1 Tax=Herminiimonas sp. CN TaxID=1349818 RepID=UPI00047407C4|nr:lipid IV(A) 3-deoxy-D-manno-octulosonic acid transferase [Herminiimonas sp. CN]
MARIAYSLAWWLALPAVLARLWWRGRKEAGYRQHLAERFGCYAGAAPAGRKILWLHAVSVGETRAAEPLVEALLAAYPAHTILLTHMTPTGRATGRALFLKHGSRVLQSYLPYDTGWMAARFLRHFSPQVCMLMETEVWPNLIAQCVAQRVPVALLNARLSARSLRRAERFGGLMREAAQRLSCVAAQTPADAQRLQQIGARNVQVTGSIKFDVVPPAAALALGESLRERIGVRPVLLCASTREGEEALILDALQAAGADASSDDMLLLLVPRHPQRFDAVAQLVTARGLTMQRRSSLDAAMAGAPIAPAVQVLLGDSMGEMFAYYAACDVAFIGGSLLPLGGQNLIEACTLGKPVLTGPHTFNFAAVTEDAIAAGAAQRVADAAALLREAALLLSQPAQRQPAGRAALAFAQQYRGATGRTLALLRALIPN